MLLEPIFWCGFWLIKKPEIGACCGKAHKGNRDHQILIDAQALQRAIQRRENENRLQREIAPFAHRGAILFVHDTKPAIPCEIDGEDAEIKHHPTENAANKRCFEFIGEMRMGAERIIKREEAHDHRETSGDEKHMGKHLPPPPVHSPALASDDRHPKDERACGTRCDVKPDKDAEDIMDRQIIEHGGNPLNPPQAD